MTYDLVKNIFKNLNNFINSVTLNKPSGIHNIMSTIMTLFYSHFVYIYFSCLESKI